MRCRNVMKCLPSVLPTLRDQDKIILVDDQSDTDTKSYLKKMVESHSDKIKLIETSEQSYYAKAASIGLAASNADFTILLNSDTIVSPNWSEKLAYLAYLDPKIGIVGPLSNAANLPSIPSIEKTTENTAINQLPKGLSVDEINKNCEEWANGLDFPEVPFVHGFCLCVKKKSKMR
jgi:GT2 family glycosyltransferase